MCTDSGLGTWIFRNCLVKVWSIVRYLVDMASRSVGRGNVPVDFFFYDRCLSSMEHGSYPIQVFGNRQETGVRVCAA